MTDGGPVERVVALLEGAGYDVVPQPRDIGGIPFEFRAMLAGRNSLDLVAVVDLATDTDDDRIGRRVTALARALDLVKSLRSVTVILVGPSHGPRLLRMIVPVARVLVVGTPEPDDSSGLRESLAVLLPLELETEGSGPEETWSTLQGQMAARHPVETAGVLAAVRSGAKGVEQASGKLLGEPIEEFYETGEPGEDDP